MSSVLPRIVAKARVLAAASAFVAGLASVAFAGGANSVDRLLPPDTLFVFSVDDDEAYQKSLEGMPFNQIMKEEEVVAFLEKPRAAIKDAINELAAKLKEQEGFENFDLSPEKLFAGKYGRVFFGLTHVGMPSPETGNPIPDLGLVVGIERREGAPDWQGLFKDVLGRVTGKMPPEMAMKFETVEKDGVTFEQLVGGPSERPPIVMGTVGNLQLFSMSPATLGAIMSRASGNAQGKSLADNPVYQRCAKNVGIDSPAAARFYVNCDAGMKVALAAVKLGLQASGKTEYIPTVDRIFDMSGLAALKAVSGAGEAVDGVAHSRMFSLVEGPRTGLLAAAPSNALDLSHLKSVPKDATSLSLSQFDFSAIYDFAMNVFKEVDEKEFNSAMEQLKGFEAMIGGQDKPLNIRNDLVGNLGPEFMFVSPPSSSAMVPSILAMIEVKDATVAVDALTKVINFAGQQSGGEVSMKTIDYKGTPIHQVDIQGTPLPISPCFAVKDKFLVFALSTGDLKKQLRSAEKAEADITSKEDFQRFWSKVPKEGVTSLSYSDVKVQVESGYGQVSTYLPMLNAMGDIELPIDPALLPQQEALTKHLFGSLTYSVKTEDGDLVEGYGPFGSEIVGAVLSTAVGAGAIVAVRAAKEEMGHVAPVTSDAGAAPRPVESQPIDLVRQDLGNLKAGVTIYKLQHNQAIPERLEQILEPSADYPQGCIGSEKLPIDPWGNAYLYKKTETGFVIWSIGPNGQDEGGAGDDIAVKK